MMVRDKESLADAEDLGIHDIQLLPDCAFALGTLPRTNGETFEQVFLLREDVEKVDFGLEKLIELAPGPVFDWATEPDAMRNRSPMAVLESVLAGRLSRSSIQTFQRDIVAKRRLARGIQMISMGKRVVSDRLHVHILCMLTNTPHVALDNSYGKVHRFIDAWTHDSALVEKALDGHTALLGLAALKDNMLKTRPSASPS